MKYRFATVTLEEETSTTEKYRPLGGAVSRYIPRNVARRTSKLINIMRVNCACIVHVVHRRGQAFSFHNYCSDSGKKNSTLSTQITHNVNLKLRIIILPCPILINLQRGHINLISLRFVEIISAAIMSDDKYVSRIRRVINFSHPSFLERTWFFSNAFFIIERHQGATICEERGSQK